ncbi:MAG: hypothetical protein DDT36_01345 [Firmicutes bacterium]|nr:hypothetical protein [Bacillota bacterium]
MEMRRLDRAVEKKVALEYLQEAQVGYLALAEDNVPYIVPLNFVLLENSIYVHSAPQGRKIDILRKNPLCSFAISFLDGIKSGSTACEYGAFYRSALITGVARFVEEPSEKFLALTALTEKHAVGEFAPVSPTGMARTTVIAIDIMSVSGKARRVR